MSSAPMTCTTINTNAVNIQKVWNESVHTSVFTPPRRVYSHISATKIGTVTQKGTPTASSTNRCNSMQTT